jgi:hypothetical protein
VSTALLMPPSSSGSPVISVLSRLTFPGWSVSRSVQTVLYRQFCPGCPIRLSYPGCPVRVVLSQMSYLNCHDCSIPVVCLSCPVLTVMFWSFCLCFLSWLYNPVCLLWHYCPGCPFPAFLSLMSSPGCLVPAACPVPAVLYQLCCPGCPVPVVLHQLSCSSCSAQTPLSTALRT